MADTEPQPGQVRDEVQSEPGRLGPGLDQRLVRSPEAAGEELPGELLVVDLGSGRYFSLGEVGGFVWSRLDGRRTLEELADEVVSRYEVSPERARQDLLCFGRQLVASGLAEPG